MSFRFCARRAESCPSCDPAPMLLVAGCDVGAAGPQWPTGTLDVRALGSLLNCRLVLTGLSLMFVVASPLNSSEAMPCNTDQELPHMPAREVGDSLRGHVGPFVCACALPPLRPNELPPVAWDRP